MLRKGNIMSIEISGSIEKQEIQKSLEKYNSYIPNDYINFLSKSNGIFISGKSYCVIPFRKVDDKEISFQELYGIKTNNVEFDLDNINDIRVEIKNFSNPIIIAGDPGGNFFLFSGNRSDNKIYYWDRAHIHLDNNYDYPEKDEEGNIYIFSNSFNEFYDLIIKNLGGDISIIQKNL